MYVKCKNGAILQHSGGVSMYYSVIDKNGNEWYSRKICLISNDLRNNPLKHTGGIYGKGWDIVEILEDYKEK